MYLPSLPNHRPSVPTYLLYCTPYNDGILTPYQQYCIRGFGTRSYSKVTVHCATLPYPSLPGTQHAIRHEACREGIFGRQRWEA